MQSYLFTCSHLWLPNWEIFTWNRATGSVLLVHEVMAELKKKNKNMSGPKSWERSTSTDLFPCQTRMEAGESLCANESVWMNRYLLVYLLLAWLPSFDPATDVNAQSRLELLRVSCFLNASISSGRVLLFREAAGCQGFQLAFGGYMTFLQCSSKI